MTYLNDQEAGIQISENRNRDNSYFGCSCCQAFIVIILIIGMLITCFYAIVPNNQYITLTNNLNCKLVNNAIMQSYSCVISCSPNCNQISNATSCTDMTNYYNNLNSINCSEYDCSNQELVTNVPCDNGYYCCNDDCSISVRNQSCVMNCDFVYTTNFKLSYNVLNETITRTFSPCNSGSIKNMQACQQIWNPPTCYYDTQFHILNYWNSDQVPDFNSGFRGGIAGVIIITIVILIVVTLFNMSCRN